MREKTNDERDMKGKVFTAEIETLTKATWLRQRPLAVVTAVKHTGTATFIYIKKKKKNNNGKLN